MLLYDYMKKYFILSFVIFGFLFSYTSFAETKKDTRVISPELQNQIDKTTTEINNIIPEKAKTSMSNVYSSIEDFRVKTSIQIENTKKITQEELNILKNKTNSDDPLKKPIIQIKLYLFSILSFIFTNKVAFYTVLILLILYLLRATYRVIKNK